MVAMSKSRARNEFLEGFRLRNSVGNWHFVSELVNDRRANIWNAFGSHYQFAISFNSE